MKLHELSNTPGARKRRKIVGRGDGSGSGGTAGRGHKGQKARSGANMRPFFEGGQVPLFRRLPKRGFTSTDHKRYTVINLNKLEENFAANDAVDLETLIKKGLVTKSSKDGLKILGSGEITKPLSVKAKKFSGSAKTKIESVGGKCEEI